MSWLDASQVVAIYNQDKIWVDRHHKTHKIAEMPNRYLYNLRGFLERQYQHHRNQVIFRDIFPVTEPHFLNILAADMRRPADEWDDIHEGLPPSVERTKLYKSICHEIGHRKKEGIVIED